MPQIKLKHKLALNPKSCAWCTVRPNKLKGQSLKQRKVNCKDQTRSMGGLCSKDPNFLMVFREECLKAKFGMRAAGCRTYFWLVGGEVTVMLQEQCVQPEVSILCLGGDNSSCKKNSKIYRYVYPFRRKYDSLSLSYSLLFLASLDLCCCMWAVSSCGEWGLPSSCNALASHCHGFSGCRAWALGCADFSSCSIQAQ